MNYRVAVCREPRVSRLCRRVAASRGFQSTEPHFSAYATHSRPTYFGESLSVSFQGLLPPKQSNTERSNACSWEEWLAQY